MFRQINSAIAFTVFLIVVSLLTTAVAFGDSPIAQTPLYLTHSLPPVTMLNISSDSQLFFQAYTDYADLDGDGAPNTTYTHSFDYYGYFDNYKCYNYSSGVFVPASVTTNKYCGGNWSGNFLNWLTMARIDVVRKILYGGYRSTDTASQTILERTYLPNDAHSWVRFYDGDDLNQLSPFSAGSETTTTSPTSQSVVTGSRRGSGDRFTLDTPGWSSSEVQLGDQLEMTHPNHPGLWMRGVVVGVELSRSPPRITIQVTGSANPQSVSGALAGWNVVNRSRRGISFCNTTITTGASHGATALSAPPRLMVAEGDYSLWTANERWQCRWREDVNPNVPDRMRLHNQPFMNGNDVVSSGLWSNADSPRRNDVRIDEFLVRVEACVAGLIGQENCKVYPNGTKPIGLFQQFGEDGQILFGLMTGSYTNHVSGGVLRKNIGNFGNEVNPDTGQFTLPSDSMVRSLNALRIFGYSHDSGEYTAGAENCVFGTSKAQMIAGRCFSWGNPQAEIYAESLRYLAGLTANSSFTHSGTDRVPNLTAAAWNNPITEDMWCTRKSIIQFNASVTSFDDGAPTAASDLPGLGSLDNWTNIVGSGEGLAGASVFAGGSTGFCTSETIGNLSNFLGLCPEAPNQNGTYHIAGLAHYARVSDLRPDWEEKQTVQTYGVSLAPAVPRIEIPLPGETEPAVTILPACDNRGDNLRCALADFRIVEQDIAEGTGKFYIQWDVSEWGADFDMDINGTLSYEIENNRISVTTQTWADSSGRETGFGYIISGTDNDGFHAHSGINNYRRTNAGSVPNCTGCNVGADPTTARFNIGGGTAELLRDPLFYAAKWGGFNDANDNQIPDLDTEWDKDGDGKPDRYFFATNPAELVRQLGQAFADVIDSNVSSTAIPSTSQLLKEDVFAFQADFTSGNWTGQVRAFGLDNTGQLNTANPVWDTNNTLTSNTSRNIFTTNPAGSGLVFSFSNLTNEQRALLGDTGAEQQAVVNWILGTDGELHQRDHLLGDIINSNPLYDADTETLYVGANDGMLHAFNTTNGQERFAFIPNAVFPHLAELADPAYGISSEHRYFVDGSPSLAKIPDPNRSLLIGTLGAGGRAVFALNVTSPAAFSASNVLWEISNHTTGFEALGQMVNQMPFTPVVGKWNGNWVAVFGNGFDSGHGAVLFVVNALTGALVAKVTASSDTANGMAGAALVLDRNKNIAGAYAGDLLGNLWKFDFTGGSVRLATNGDPLFVAKYPGENPQPITAAVNYISHPEGGNLVLFGTGQFMRDTDTTDLSVQTAYGIWDNATLNTNDSVTSWGSGNKVNSRSELLEQEFEYSQTFSTVWETVSNRQINWSEHRGWYIDLIAASAGGSPQGERIIYQAVLMPGTGEVLFSSIVPNPSMDVCEGGEPDAWHFVLNALTGGFSIWTRFDVNEDGVFDIDDVHQVTDPDTGEVIPVPFVRYKTRYGGSPTAVGSSSQDCIIGQRCLTRGPPRQSWRQLR